VHDFAADNLFRYYQGLGGKTPRPLIYLMAFAAAASGARAVSLAGL
jgi:hypothetical protein